MIVTGTCRAAPHHLAHSLRQPNGDKLVHVLELPYPTSLRDLFLEWQCLSEVTHGAKGLYHAQICPAPGNPMTTARWLRSADILGEDLGLQQHLRAVVLHEDGERSYLHVVWQRTDIDTWTLWNDGKNYRKHERASRRMEQEFGQAPVPDKRAKDKPVAQPDPPGPAFNRDEGRQARRTDVRITAMKAKVAALKTAAESPEAFRTALENAGYILARGDSGYILVDCFSSVYSLAGQLKQKLARVNEFMAPVSLDSLPTADEAKDRQFQLNPQRKDAL